MTNCSYGIEQRQHRYADDKQVYADTPLSDIEDLGRCLHDCTADVSGWCASRRLQLNETKTEHAWFGKRSRLDKLAAMNRTVAIGSSKNLVRDLGVMFDSELSMKQRVTK